MFSCWLCLAYFTKFKTPRCLSLILGLYIGYWPKNRNCVCVRLAGGLYQEIQSRWSRPSHPVPFLSTKFQNPKLFIGCWAWLRVGGGKNGNKKEAAAVSGCWLDVCRGQAALVRGLRLIVGTSSTQCSPPSYRTLPSTAFFGTAQCPISPYRYCQLPYSRCRPSVAPCSSVLTGHWRKARAMCTGNILPLFQNHCHGCSSSSCWCWWWSELIKKSHHSLLLCIMSVAIFSDIFTRKRILNSTQNFCLKWDY